MGSAEALRIPESKPPAANGVVIETETVDCLMCGGDDFETVIIASDPTTGIGGRFRVVRCRDCRLAFTNPRPTPTSIGPFYPDDYQPYISRPWSNTARDRRRRSLEAAVLQRYFGYPGESSNWKNRWRAWWGKRRIRRSRQRQSWIPFREPGRLLDFGCGAGMFLREMHEFGWSVEGLDFSLAMARQVGEEHGIKVHVGTLPHADVTPQSFDAVTMWNSLEHVFQPRETVRHAGTALRSGGLLVVGVPNFDSWSFQTFQQEIEQICLKSK